MENNKTGTLDGEKLWDVAWTYIKTVVDTVREPFLVLDEKLLVLSANKTFYLFFQVKEKETVGKEIYNLGSGQWDITKLKSLLEDILPKNTFFEDFKVDYNFPKIGRRIIMLNARRIFTVNNERPLILLAMEDITKQIELEDKMKAYTKELTMEVAKRTEELESRVKELESINQDMIGREIKMVELKKEIEELKKQVKNGNNSNYKNN